MNRMKKSAPGAGGYTFCGQNLAAWKPKTLAETYERVHSKQSGQSLLEQALHFLENPCTFCETYDEETHTYFDADYAFCLATVAQLLQILSIRQPPKQTLLEELERLVAESALPQGLAESFGKTAPKLNLEPIRSHRAPIPGAFNRLKDVRWRLDVVISTDATKKVLRPNVIIEFVLGDGSLARMKLSIQQFHQLRYATAKNLKEMEIVREHPLMKLLIER